MNVNISYPNYILPELNKALFSVVVFLFSFGSFGADDNYSNEFNERVLVPVRNEIAQQPSITCFISKLDGDPLAEQQDLFIALLESIGLRTIKDNPDLEIGEDIDRFMSQISKKDDGKYCVDHVLMFCTESFYTRSCDPLSGVAKEVRLVESRIREGCRAESFLTCILFSGYTRNAIPLALSSYLHTSPAIVENGVVRTSVMYHILMQLVCFKFFLGNEKIRAVCAEFFNDFREHLPTPPAPVGNPFEILTKHQSIISGAVKGRADDLAAFSDVATFLESAEQMFTVGLLHTSGIPPHIPQNPQIAFNFFAAASETPHFHGESMCHLAGYYIKGLVVEKDHEYAKKILEDAYNRHNENIKVLPYLMRAYKLLGDKERCKQCSDKYVVLARTFNANNPLAD